VTITDWTTFDRQLASRRRAIVELVPYANQNNRQHGPNEHMKLDHLLTDLGAPVPAA
jgi:hypothetical protein